MLYYKGTVLDGCVWALLCNGMAYDMPVPYIHDGYHLRVVYICKSVRICWCRHPRIKKHL